MSFVDSEHPDVIAFARETVGDARTDGEKAARLFLAVRERLRYDPYTVSADPDEYRASTILRRERAFCIPKAVLLCAAARAAGLAAKLGFADVKNHLASPKLIATLGSDLFVWHGYVTLAIEGRTVKVTPAFNAALCARFKVAPLELSPTDPEDALLQPFDGEGRPYMAYVRERGLFDDLPLPEILADFEKAYGHSAAGGGGHDAAFHDP